ncbi:MAG: ATP-binding protein [Aeromicrobium sp.]
MSFDPRDPLVALGGIDQWAEAALAELTGLPDVLRAGVALTEGGGRRLLFTASDRARDVDGLDWCHVDAFATVPLNDAIRSLTPVAGALDALDERYAAFASAQHGTGFVAVATVPLTADDAVLGGFVVYYGSRQSFGERQVAELLEIAAWLAQRLSETLHHEPLSPSSPVRSLPEGSLVAVREIPPDLAAVAEARGFLRRTLTRWEVNAETTDDAVLCLSELVTNAVIHTTGGCHVQVELHEGVLTSRVLDNGSVITPAAVSSHDAVVGHGHGLNVVAALSRRWGRSADPAEAWFELEVS